MIERPDWKTARSIKEIDLAGNVHYDKILIDYIKKIDIKNIHNYPDQFKLYESLSNYYNISLENLTIGFGAGEIISRCLESFVKHLYIVEPTFEMTRVYCEIHNIPFTLITIDEVYDLPKSSQVYIANPNGNTGEAYDLSKLEFDLLILDEAYADFYPEHSRLNENHEWLITVKTISKSLGLAGLRVGFCKASKNKTYILQSTRNNFITSSYAAEIIPKVINQTAVVVQRMNEAKEYLESTFICKPSKGNYVLFKEPNYLTQKFNYKLVDGYYRMALTNLEIIKNYAFY
jgi:histidinol-phosphate aminotransferase|tara:strand:+ start:351 stop:1217 length:867 start_codon:yes stop_codon:yes gene_type:complete